ncbi:thymidylate kinase [Phlyctochytrium arcticum]|nr:thymidylate kinase [Phlyctochytrium arcticum]
MTNRRGAFIVLEGIDRSGKSTQTQRIQQALKERGIPAVLQRFPDRTTPTGILISDYLSSQTATLNDQTVHLLFSANRWEATKNLKSLLEQGTSIVVDRYAYSGVAYSAAKGLDLEWCKAPDKGLINPDLVIYLQTSPSVAASRSGYGEERYEKQDFQEKVESVYRQLGSGAKEWVIVNAQQDIEDVHRDIWKVVEATVERVSGQPIMENLWQQ